MAVKFDKPTGGVVLILRPLFYDIGCFYDHDEGL